MQLEYYLLVSHNYFLAIITHLISARNVSPTSTRNACQLSAKGALARVSACVGPAAYKGYYVAMDSVKRLAGRYVVDYT